MPPKNLKDKNEIKEIKEIEKTEEIKPIKKVKKIKTEEIEKPIKEEKVKTEKVKTEKVKTEKVKEDKGKVKKSKKEIIEVPQSDSVYYGKQVLIVESPNKIKKINEILDKIKKHPNFENCEFKVTASCGHIREIDKKHVGISLDTFEPNYLISESKTHIVHDLKEEVRDAKMVWLCPDADREGESIAWHLMDVLKLKEGQYNRATFNEITEKAIMNSLLHPRKVDLNMYYSQKARSVIDKLIGYLISPVLDSQFQTFGLSAGRVQSVAVKLVSEREKEIEKFESSGYYQTKGVFNPIKSEIKNMQIPADLDKTFENKDMALEFLELSNTAEYKIIDVSVNKTKRKPTAPFITSTIQQEASNKLGLSPDSTMKILQKLFEAGHITYHRTDSLILSEDSKKEIQQLVSETYGDEYYQNNVYANKDDAQAAHEPIRPTHMENKDINLTGVENRLYQMIYNRTMASQMAPAAVDIKTVKIGMSNSNRIFLVKAENITYKGFLVIYEKDKESKELKSKKGNDDKEGADEEEDNNDDDEIIDNSELYEILDKLETGDIMKYKVIESTEKFSKPPQGRYTEASLIKELEKRGIGRPSTFSSIIAKIQDTKRNYVKIMDKKPEKKDSFILQYNKGKFNEKIIKVNMGGYTKKLVALETGKTIVGFLDINFDTIMDYNFTKNTEKELDEIAEGKFLWNIVVKSVYDIFSPQIEIVRGKQAGGEKGKVKKYLGVHPDTNNDVVILYNKSGPSIYTEINGEKKYCNITDDEATTMTVERALELMKYPIILKSPSGSEEENIEICKGKTNYYLKQNKKSVSFTDNVEEEPKEITWLVANELFKHNMESTQSRIIKSFTEDPKLTIVNARFGPCIEYAGKKTKIFVSIPKNKNSEDITFEECVILVNKKKENLKNGVKAKPFRKFNKKE
jgi:DNA topoisomerase-1